MVMLDRAFPTPCTKQRRVRTLRRRAQTAARGFLDESVAEALHQLTQSGRGSVEIQALLDAAHTRVRVTLTAKRALLESLGKLLITDEVVDRNALTRLLGTAVTEKTPYAPVGTERTAAPVGALKPLVTPSYNGGQTTAVDSRE